MRLSASEREGFLPTRQDLQKISNGDESDPMGVANEGNEIVVTGSRTEIPTSFGLPPEGVQLACAGRYITVCRDAIRSVVTAFKPVVKQPFKGPRAQDFGRRAGFERSLEASKRGLNQPFDAVKHMQQLKAGGYTQQDVIAWQRFYADQYLRVPKNYSAFHRSEVLRMIRGVWR